MKVDENKKNTNMSISRKKQRQNVMQMLYQMDIQNDFLNIETINTDKKLKDVKYDINLENCDSIDNIEHIKKLISDFSGEKLPENFELSDFIENDDLITYEVSNTYSYSQEKLEDFSDIGYIKLFISSFLDNKELIDSEISQVLSDKWTVKRLAKIDLALIRTAITEIKYLDIPYKVAINEALELAKKYSDEKSSSFINGILKDYVNCFIEKNS
ncbi:NusB antitermination factor [[Eubacterium] yurii]|jgi:transcription antitermination factor nusB|nr:NusB antitermination factor [[Eubacterium] yurii]